MKMQQIEVDDEIVTKIKALGYKQSEIDNELKIPNTPINNLYQLLIYKRIQQKEEEQAAAENNIKSKPKTIYLGEVSGYSSPDLHKQEEKKPTVEEMARKFFKIRKKNDSRFRYHKIRFVEPKK